MSTAPALRLAGEIAAQFRHLPETEAAERVAQHIRMFWDPRMRRQLRELTEEPAPGLDPLLSRVAELLGDS